MALAGCPDYFLHHPNYQVIKDLLSLIMYHPICVHVRLFVLSVDGYKLSTDLFWWVTGCTVHNQVYLLLKIKRKIQM